jgi:1-acyl-sn-glycerol-3-phosphate acyltransferase
VNTQWLPKVPSQAPHSRRGLVARSSAWILRTSGWRLQGEFPDAPKLVIIGAPHSSYWDGVLGLLMKLALGLDINIMIKREVMDGPMGPVLRRLGLIPIDRTAAIGVVQQMVRRMRERERMWLGITPEGTRKRVKHWKSGFLRIAHEADVPILPVFVDYPSKSFTLGSIQHATGHRDEDLERIRALFSGYHGKHRDA